MKLKHRIKQIWKANPVPEFTDFPYAFLPMRVQKYTSIQNKSRIEIQKFSSCVSSDAHSEIYIRTNVRENLFSGRFYRD